MARYLDVQQICRTPEAVDNLFLELVDDLEFLHDASPHSVWGAIERTIDKVLGPTMGPSKSWTMPTWRLGQDAYLFTVSPDLAEFVVIAVNPPGASSSGTYQELDTIEGLAELRDFLKEFVRANERCRNPVDQEEEDADGYFVLERSSRPKKKWMVRVPTVSGRGRTIHFGDASMEDFTMHGDLRRRESYRSRHRRDNIDDPYSPGFWSWHVLWGDSDDLDVSLRRAVRLAKKKLSDLPLN